MPSRRTADESNVGSASDAAPPRYQPMLERLQQPVSFRRRPAGAPTQGSLPRTRLHAPRVQRVRSLVGLEIEPGQLVAAKSHLDGRVVVDRAVGTPIAPSLVRDGEVTDLDGLTSALSELFDGSGL